jgi:hypothetical protein
MPFQLDAMTCFPIHHEPVQAGFTIHVCPERVVEKSVASKDFIHQIHKTISS